MLFSYINFIDFIGLFILVAGFIIGLGAVVVIDFHGFLGRKSSYWTEATTRTHKVTKPLIWVGTVMILIGGFLFYRNSMFWPIPVIHFIIVLILILNGLFLSFRVSPYMLQREKEGKSGEILPKEWQRKIMISLIFSDFGWWLAVAVLVYFLISR
jgi:hypothetical protein